jgi:hypothetical protein
MDLRGKKAPQPLLPLALALGVGLLSVDGFFVIDDFFLLNMVEQRTVTEAFDYWSQDRDYFDGSWSILAMKYGAHSGEPDRSAPFLWYWRPLPLLCLMVQSHLFGNWAPGFHLTSVFLHVLTTLALMWWVSQLIGPSAARVAGIWYALFPASAVTVSWISTQSDLWFALFVSLSMGVTTRMVQEPVARRWPLLLLLLGTAALLAKEIAIVVAPMMCAAAFLARAFRPTSRIPKPFWLTIGALVSLSAIQFFYTQHLSLRSEGYHLGVLDFNSGLQFAQMWPFWLQRLAGAVTHLFFWVPIYPGIYPFAPAPPEVLVFTATLAVVVVAVFLHICIWYRGLRLRLILLALLVVLPLAQLYVALAYRFLTPAAIGISLIIAWSYSAMAPYLPRRLLALPAAVILVMMTVYSGTAYFVAGENGRELRSYTQRLIKTVKRYNAAADVQRVYLLQRPLALKILDESYERLDGPRLKSPVMTLTAEDLLRPSDMSRPARWASQKYCEQASDTCFPQRLEIKNINNLLVTIRAVAPPALALPLFDMPGPNDARRRPRLSYRDPNGDFSITEAGSDEKSGLPKRLIVRFATPISDPQRLVLVDDGKRFRALGRRDDRNIKRKASPPVLCRADCLE